MASLIFSLSFWVSVPIQLVYGCLPSPINSHTVRFLEAMGSVSTTLISEASSLLECCSSDVLFSSIVPDKLGCILPKVLNKVDFPMPFTPTMEASSPLKRVKLISLAIQFCCFLTVYPMLRFFVSRAICDGVFFILNRFLLLLRYWFLFAFAGFS